MRTRADIQMMIGLAQAELAEEHSAHRLVVMLARMDENRLQVMTLEGSHNWSDFHEVRPRGRNAEEPHERENLELESWTAEASDLAGRFGSGRAASILAENS